MAKELISALEGKLSFGDFDRTEKAKLDGFALGGNIYKVKTFCELTKLERDGMFVYESEPGTEVCEFAQTTDGLTFAVTGKEDTMITVGLEEDTCYEVFENEVSAGKMKTNLGGKLSISVSLSPQSATKIRIMKADG